MLSYQGKLTDTLGLPVADTTYSVTFGLYTQPTGGSPFWNETQTVETRSGLFSALLGSVTPVGSMPDAGAAYLGMAVDGGAELSPRLRIASAAYAYLAARAANADLLQGRDTTTFSRSTHDHDATYVNEGQANSVSSGMITNGTIAAADLSQMGAGTGQVMKWIGSAWAPRNDSVGGGGGGDNAWVRSGSDSVLYTINRLGIARGGSNNALYGTQRFTHVNLGIACTTGTSGQNYSFATVGGGWQNTASNTYATVGGGHGNTASGYIATVAGGESNTASNNYATVAGGESNTASNTYATVGGGKSNITSGTAATVGGGWQNTAASIYATVGGGYTNDASGSSATVAGGRQNTASGYMATVAGGGGDTSAADYSFTTNTNSVVPSGYNNSAAFNGQTATAANQTRVGTLSKASGTFTIDHPLDPSGKILNHYFIEGPEMLNIYRGSVILDAVGRAEVSLPDYFGALNRNPMVQLTGVGTSEVVYVAEKVAGNRFVVGGPAGAEVYGQVTGERKDVSAEATRRMMPVEQPKNGPLAGRMLDDEFLSGCMDQLVREGKAQGIDFRTAAGRQRYEKMRQHLRDAGQQ